MIILRPQAANLVLSDLKGRAEQEAASTFKLPERVSGGIRAEGVAIVGIKSQNNSFCIVFTH